MTGLASEIAAFEILSLASWATGCSAAYLGHTSDVTQEETD